MNVNEGTLYPMLGVGTFMPMFWLGFLLGYEAGLNCMLLLLSGFASGGLGTCLVARLESFATGRRPLPRAPSARPNLPATPPLSAPLFSRAD